MEKHRHPLSYISGKIGRYIIVFMVIITLNFLLPRLMPGDPVKNIMGEEAFYGSTETLEQMRENLGLNGSLASQYVHYLGDLFTGDWGYSYLSMRPVLDAVALHLRWTLILVIPSIILGAIIATIFGSIAAWRRKSRLDMGLSVGFLSAYAMPHFWLAMTFLFFFSFQLDWFPLGKVSSGDTSGLSYIADVAWHMVLPLTVLTILKSSYDFLIVRSSVTSILGEDYVLMAQAKGLSQRVVLFKHVLRNALAPLATVTAMQFGAMLSGALLVEIIFSWPGMGTLIYDAIQARDYPVLQGAFLMIAICMLLANCIADLLYAWLDPRTR